MKVKKLRAYLRGIDGEAEILISSDEELNALFSDGEVCELTGKWKEKTKFAIFGYSGSEIEL